MFCLNKSNSLISSFLAVSSLVAETSTLLSLSSVLFCVFSVVEEVAEATEEAPAEEAVAEETVEAPVEE
mgnify:CR=1 FL=1